MKKTLFLTFTYFAGLCGNAFASFTVDAPLNTHISVIGGGIVGALESYYAYKEAQKEDKKIGILVYEKAHSFESSNTEKSSTNTSYNIVPSLPLMRF